jgi:hypothetical protein
MSSHLPTVRNPSPRMAVGGDFFYVNLRRRLSWCPIKADSSCLESQNHTTLSRLRSPGSPNARWDGPDWLREQRTTVQDHSWS